MSLVIIGNCEQVQQFWLKIMNKEFITDFKVHPYTEPNFFGYGRIEYFPLA